MGAIADSSRMISASKVQQESRTISQFGSPTVSSQPRGYSSGRKFGQIQSPPSQLPVIKKAKPQRSTTQTAA